MLKEIKSKHQILLRGGEYDEEGAQEIETWLEFLTDIVNLRPGLPELTIYFGFERFNFINVAFDSNCASLRSIHLQLELVEEDNVSGIFQDENPDRLKDWIHKLFHHRELEELKVPFKNSKLPDRFDELQNLRSADFQHASLVELPPSFYQLPGLEILNINYSQLKEVPPAIAHLPLRSLSFSQPCTAQTLGSLKGLTELKCFCKNFMVPDEIAQLTQLASLYLASVSHATDSLLDLPYLRKLTLKAESRSFTFKNIPGKLPNLKELETNNALVFADVLSNFVNLEKLVVDGQSNGAAIGKLEESLPKLANLKYLSLEGVGLTSMDWCESLLKLEYLGLGNNLIRTIPLSLADLKKLKTIILRGNPITSFPEIPAMPQVIFIDLKDTEIPEDENAIIAGQPIPEELNKLKRIFPNVAYLSNA